MNKLILIAAAAPLSLALSACGGNDVDAPDSENVDLTVGEDGAVVDNEVALGNQTNTVEGTPYADTAWEYTGADGTVITSSLRSDGSYQDVGGDEVRDQGTWSYDEQNRICFDSSMENDNDQCWDGPPQPVGNGQSYVANSDTGMSMELTRTTYRPAAREAPGS
ncbi:hypothetical protein WJT74_06930 [Sphingomicrobium sp. XHP0239]|uniref:hypothetical protein n=1 Tax=Sphingomicrobium maritimum TaxID=3133972 RepID=UPI0031CC980D